MSRRWWEACPLGLKLDRVATGRGEGFLWLTLALSPIHTLSMAYPYFILISGSLAAPSSWYLDDMFRVADVSSGS